MPLIAGMVKAFEELGGKLRLSSPVEGIDLVADPTPKHHLTYQSPADGVKTDVFDLVVSNADVHHTYGTLYKNTESALERSQKLERMNWSMSLYVLYFGTDRKYENVAHHTVLFGNRYKPLLNDIFHGSDVPDDFSLYLHAPTVTDTSLAPDGCEGFYVLSPVPHLGQANVNWAEKEEAYGDKILAYLEKALLPDLRKHVIARRALTPFGFRDDLRSFQGSAFSVAPRLTQSAYFRPHNRDQDIPGLYIAGAGTHPGAGVPGVVNAAAATVKTILEDVA